ncbi:winged helix-turn-helix transcriptional regulator [Nocardia sp. CDC160]|uniref:winged helix-turn-helix transcriptional regulator n=1 Tax=Nocardia sp. CDC160 TaxID=3112166 RepID=UPI002DB8433E|nr:helix-turn-helix domain-containing protein [Nocardia sp. CDC160]MEC3919825.1 helix-turn-helix domain-containing protein [Nocardia sp. CDC160]
MLPRAYDSQHCSIAATLEIVGDRWTLLILRESCRGVTRFADFQHTLGLARTVLSDRLARLTEQGLLERHRYQERPERFEYLLTDKGAELWPVLNALMTWGDKHIMADRPPVVVRHNDCGGLIDGHRICRACHRPVELRDVYREPGPGALPVPGRA